MGNLGLSTVLKKIPCTSPARDKHTKGACYGSDFQPTLALQAYRYSFASNEVKIDPRQAQLSPSGPNPPSGPGFPRGPLGPAKRMREFQHN